MYGYGNSMFLATHGILARSGPTGPVNTVAPAITGTAQEGRTLTCSTGTWTGITPITYAYQWKRNNVNIGSATNSTYLLVAADVGQNIKCTVTATNVTGSASADSNTVGPIAAFSYLLDTYSGAAAAYSLRKLRSAYTGNCIRVRRSSDNTEQNVGFVNNVLDTASLLTFVGAGNGFVTTFYDQSGNSKDITQSTGVNQPRIVIGGALVTNPTNGYPCLNYTTAVGAQNWLQLTNQTFNGDNTLFGVYNWNSGDSGILSYGQASSGKRRAIFVFSPTGSAPWYSYASGYAQNLQIAAAATSTNYVTYSLFNTTSQQIEGSVNGGSVQSASRTLSNSAAAPLYLGRTESGEYLDGNIFEAIFYNSNQSTNRAGIRDNINSFYTIY